MRTLRDGWRSHVWPEWEIVGPIGSGSYGSVYRLRRQDMGGTYDAALKVITIHPGGPLPGEYYEDGTASATSRSRTAEDYARELAFLESLKGHTNIVSYEDHKIVPTEEGGFYILLRMELLTPLRVYMEEKPRTEKEIAVLGQDICRALTVCEKLRIIHRDIKPENIFVSRLGDFKLGDFGIAKQTDPGTAPEKSRKGTLFYMAPEMYFRYPYRGNVDIYALGLVLYRYLNGSRPPFIRADEKIGSYEQLEQANMRRLSGESLPPPAGASFPMWAILRRACAYNPSHRYQRAEEMLRDLTRFLEGKTGETAGREKTELSAAADWIPQVSAWAGKVRDFVESLDVQGPRTEAAAPVISKEKPGTQAPERAERESGGEKPVNFFKRPGDL